MHVAYPYSYEEEHDGNQHHLPSGMDSKNKKTIFPIIGINTGEKQ